MNNFFIQLLNRFLAIELNRVGCKVGDWEPMFDLQQDIAAGHIHIAFNKAAKAFMWGKNTPTEQYYGWLAIHNSIRRHPSLVHVMEGGIANCSAQRASNMKYWARRRVADAQWEQWMRSA
jgi:hypothetical protein